MRYLLFVCADASGEPFDPSQNNIEEWVSTNDRKGSRLLGYRLDDVRKAKTVRVRKGQLLVTDGPSRKRRNGLPASISSSAMASMRLSRSRRSIPWPASAGSKSDRCGLA